MRSTTLNDIQLAIYERVDAATGLLPIKYQSKDFEHNGSPYAEIIVSPSETLPTTIDGDTMYGFLLVNIYVPKNYGAFYPAEQGQKFIELFPRDFSSDEFRIIKTGDIRLPVKEGVWEFTPVVFEYEADSWQQ